MARIIVKLKKTHSSCGDSTRFYTPKMKCQEKASMTKNIFCEIFFTCIRNMELLEHQLPYGVNFLFPKNHIPPEIPTSALN